MANVNAPFGAVGIHLAKPGNKLKCQVLANDAAVLGFGDLVTFATLSNDGLPTITRATNSTVLLHGIVTIPQMYGWLPSTNDRRRPASTLTLTEIQLLTPGDLIAMQTDGSATISNTLANFYVNLSVATDASSVTSQSTATIQASSISSSVTNKPLRIIGMWVDTPKPVNDVNDYYCDVLAQVVNGIALI